MIAYWAKQNSGLQNRGGLAAEWASATERRREVIVQGMATAKDEDEYDPSKVGFGTQGVDAYRIVKGRRLLDP